MGNLVSNLLKQIKSFPWDYITMMMKVICMWIKKKICQFKAHDSTPWYEICLGNVSKDFIKNDVSENLLSGTVYYLSVDQSAIGKEDLLNIHD